MKKKMELTVFIMFLTLLSCNNAQKPRNIEAQKATETKEVYSNEQIVRMIKDFYNIWITESSKSFVNKEEQKLIINKYCSLPLIKHLDSLEKERLLDYDPFMNSQIVMLACLNTLKINKDSVKNNLYFISYHLPNLDNDLITIELTVTKENGAYKIDSLLKPNHH